MATAPIVLPSPDDDVDYCIDGILGPRFFTVRGGVVIHCDRYRRLMGQSLGTVKKLVHHYQIGTVKRVDILQARGWRNWRRLSIVP